MKKQPNQVFITIAKTDEGTSHGKPSWCLAWYNSSTVDCPTIPTQRVLHRWRSRSSLATCFPAHRRANAWSPLENVSSVQKRHLVSS